MDETAVRPIETRILEALSYYGRADLAQLLGRSRYELDISSTYGRAYSAYRTTIQMYWDIRTHERILTLSDPDKEDVYKAFQVVHPLQSGGLDICWIESFVDPSIPIPTPTGVTTKLSSIDLAFISEQINKCDTKLAVADYEGALTNARSLLEATLKHILDQAGETYEASDDLVKLYRKAAVLLKMNPADYANDSFKKILSGFFGIVQGVSETRNAFSDAHGRTAKHKYKLEARHAKLVVDAVKTVAEFTFRSFTERAQ